jgi:hypothetical protein
MTMPLAAIVSVLAALTLLGAAPATQSSAKFEPPDGVTYHGLCLPGYWAEAEFNQNLEKYRKNVTERPPVLHSWFAHCQEHGKWRTWHWISPTPDGRQCAGEARSFAELDRKHGFVPVIAWTWMKAFCWFEYGSQWDIERDARQLAEYRKRIADARYAKPFVDLERSK